MPIQNAYFWLFLASIAALFACTRAAQKYYQEKDLRDRLQKLLDNPDTRVR